MDSFCDQLGMPFSNHCSSLALFQDSGFGQPGQWGFAISDPTLAVWWMCNLAGVWRIVAQPDFLLMDCDHKCRCFDGKAHVSPVLLAKCE